MNKTLNLNGISRLKTLRFCHMAIQKTLILMICVGFATTYANSSYAHTTLSVDVNNLNNGELQSAISGVVSDADGNPLPGANVLVKGTTTGTQTDFDGNYTINADNGATLVFSYIGFKTKEIAVNGNSSINVMLEEDASQLEEVVVLGYSTQTRGDLTGSVASVDVKG